MGHKKLSTSARRKWTEACGPNNRFIFWSLELAGVQVEVDDGGIRSQHGHSTGSDEASM
jgi:hypothetical protein